MSLYYIGYLDEKGEGFHHHWDLPWLRNAWNDRELAEILNDLRNRNCQNIVVAEVPYSELIEGGNGDITWDRIYAFRNKIFSVTNECMTCIYPFNKEAFHELLDDLIAAYCKDIDGETANGLIEAIHVLSEKLTFVK